MIGINCIAGRIRQRADRAGRVVYGCVVDLIRRMERGIPGCRISVGTGWRREGFEVYRLVVPSAYPETLQKCTQLNFKAARRDPTQGNPAALPPADISVLGVKRDIRHVAGNVAIEPGDA